ncbi:hypothetical protein F9898_08080 [Mycobacterium tuberculosis]|nr:hypothetical protein F9898_08080 [Mycobacterium tuberculosis]QOO93710.1 hypothetical protein FPJ40_00185 [Mycobacterium tuberculosis]
MVDLKAHPPPKVAVGTESRGAKSNRLSAAADRHCDNAPTRSPNTAPFDVIAGPPAPAPQCTKRNIARALGRIAPLRIGRAAVNYQ